MANDATASPANAVAPGRSPWISPTNTGMTALTTAVSGATTVIAPARQGRVERHQPDRRRRRR